MEYSNETTVQTAPAYGETVVDVSSQPARRQLSERARNVYTFGGVFLFSVGLVSGFAVTAKALLTAWIGA